MALLYFYDATDIDKRQLSAGLQRTDHHWEYVDKPISAENINPETEVISVFVTSKVTKEIIEKLPKLKLIACRSTGFNNVDLHAAEEHGVSVVNVPSYGEKTVAEYTFAMLLTLSRKMREASSSLDTTEQPHMMGWDLAGKTIGVIGTGRIGSNVIKIAHGFDMTILAYDPFPKNNLANELGYAYVGLEELLQKSDVITIHVPYNGKNKHLIDESCFKLMKPTAVLINTSRGELVDAAALVGALLANKLQGAALDVIEDEQILSLHGDLELLQKKSGSRSALMHSIELLALEKMPNVLLTPHNAFNTIEALDRINQTTVNNIEQYWYGNIPNKVAYTPTMGKLYIIRHTESEWNAKGVWTGMADVNLSEKGFHETGLLGQLLPDDVAIDHAYVSEQIRTLETISGVLNASQHFDVPIDRVAAINERDYGIYTGKNKWEVKEQIGEEAFQRLRRDWDYPVPHGETLKDVYERAYPFYRDVVLSQLKDGKNILIAAHGNTIRSLMHYIESIPEEKMAEVEMLFGALIEYEVDQDGRMLSKKEYSIDSPKPPA